MKNNNLVLSPLAFLLIIAGLIGISPDSPGQNSPKSARGIVIPADLNKVFTHSCMPCHSDRGKEMTKALLNFSKWEKYGRRAQVQKSRSICRKITKDEMPPAQFRESSPELALTKEQKDSICKWVSSISSKK